MREQVRMRVCLQQQRKQEDSWVILLWLRISMTLLRLGFKLSGLVITESICIEIYRIRRLIIRELDIIKEWL